MWPETGFLIPFQICKTNLIVVFLKTWDISTLSITYKCVHINTNVRLRNSMNLRNGKHKKNITCSLWIHNSNMKILVNTNVT